MEKKKLFIHIGMGKTGTTALQEFFWSNRKKMKKRGICYPKVGNVCGAHHLLSPHIPVFLKDVWNFINIDKWSVELTEIYQDKVLLSSELMAWAEEKSAVMFCQKLSELFDVKIVIYLRRQDNLIMAGYNQQIKAGTQKKDIYAVLDQQFERFDYEKKLRPWTSILGYKSVIVRPYEKLQFYKNDIRRDFMYNVFGIDELDNFLFNNTNTNPRLSFAAMEYKRMLNNIIDDTVESSKFNNLLLQFSADTDSSSTTIYNSDSLLSPKERIDILERSEEINRMIACNYMGRKEGKLFLEPYPETSEKWIRPEVTSSDFARITEYIKANKPKLINIIENAIEKALISKEPLKNYAASCLKRSLRISKIEA